MFDSHKIDVYFEGEKPFENLQSDNKAQMPKRLRLMKLFFPCLAALLVGLMVVVPNVRKSVELQDRTTLPHKEELEKLHVEAMVFHITDRKNRVNEITAETIDETEVKSNKVKIINPRGTIPVDDGNINITSKIGYYSQATNTLDLQQDVVAVLNDDTNIVTSNAIYDFSHEFGFGNEHVSAYGSWGKLEADGFTYDKNIELLTLVGNNEITSPNGILSATEKTEIYHGENRVFAYGKATIKQDRTVLKADEIVGWFSDDNKHELQRAEAYGSVVIKTDKETAFGAEGYFNRQEGKIELFGEPQNKKGGTGRVEIKQDKNTMYANRVEVLLSEGETQNLKKVTAYGNVQIKTPKGTAQGDTGIYNPQKNIVELFGNVIIEQDGNFIKGTHAETDLKTSISSIRSEQKAGGRISGTFYKKKRK